MAPDDKSMQVKRSDIDQILQQETRVATDFNADTNMLNTNYNAEYYNTERTLKDIKVIDAAMALKNEENLKISKEEEASLKSIRTRNISHVLLNNQKFTGDSSEMRAVKRDVVNLEHFIHNNRNAVMTKEVIENLSIAYLNAIASCKHYASSKNPFWSTGQRRLALVNDIMASLSEELNSFKIINECKNIDETTTLAQCLHLDNGKKEVYAATINKDTLGKKEVYAATINKDTLGKKEVKIKSNTQTVINYFNGKTDPLSLVKKAKLKNGDEDKQDISSPHIDMHKLLSKFKYEGTCLEDITLNGIKIRILQKSDHSLYIIQDNEEIDLKITTERLMRNIENVITTNSSVYGDYADTVIQTLIFNMKYAIDDVDELEEDGGVSRNICVHYLESIYGIPATDFDYLSGKDVWTLCVRALKTQTKENKEVEMREFLNMVKNKNLINSKEVLEKLEESKKDLNKDDKVKHIEIPEEIKSAAKNAKEEWTENEKKVKALMADLIYSEDTWLADNNITKPGMRMQKILYRHSEILSILFVDLYTTTREYDKKQKAEEEAKQEIKQEVEKEKLIEGMFSKLYIDEFISDNTDSKNNNSQDIRSKLHPALKAVTNFIDLQIKDQFEAMPEESNLDAFTRGAITLAVGAAKSSVKSANGLISKLLAEDKINENILSGLAELEQKVDGYTDTALNSVQNIITLATDDIFNEEVEEAQDEVEKTADKGKKTADKLEKMLKDVVKGESGQGLFFKEVLKNYFKAASSIDKRAMLAPAIRAMDAVKMPPPLIESASDEQRAAYKKEVEEKRTKVLSTFMRGLLKGAGPLLQKILQGMATESMPETIKNAVEDMKSNLAPIPKEVVDAQILSLIKSSNGSVTSIDVVKSLGAASIGQAFLCVAHGPKLGDGEEIVVKILRPDAHNRMEREKKVMLECASKVGPGMVHTYKGNLSRITEELDFTIEKKNCVAGSIYNDESKHIKSVEVSDLFETTTSVIALKKAKGVTVDKYIKELRDEVSQINESMLTYKIDENGNYMLSNNKRILSLDKNGNPEYSISEATLKALSKQKKDIIAKEFSRIRKKREYLVNIANAWVMQGIFGAGFYHGDLHAGNMMIDDDGLTVIDFGNATKLTEENQIDVTRMMLAATTQDAESFLHSFHMLLQNTPEKIYQEKRGDLLKAFEDVFSYGEKSNAGQRIAVALLKAQELGFELPPSIANFSASQLRLQNAIQEMSTLETELFKAVKNILTLETRNFNFSGSIEMNLRSQYSGENESMQDQVREQVLKNNFTVKEDVFISALESTEKDAIEYFENNYLGQLTSSDSQTDKNIKDDLIQRYNAYREIQKDPIISKEEKQLKGKSFFKFYADAYVEKVYSSSIWDDFHRDLQNVNAIANIEESLAVYFEDKENEGELLKEKFEAYRNELNAYTKRCELIDESRKEEGEKIKKEKGVLSAQDEIKIKEMFPEEDTSKSEATRKEFLLVHHRVMISELQAIHDFVAPMRSTITAVFAEINKNNIPNSFFEIMGEILTDNFKKSMNRIGWLKAIRYGLSEI